MSAVEKHKPGFLYVDYTYRCNLKCKFCASDGTNSPEMRKYALGEWDNFFLEHADHSILHLSGGEPTVEKDFLDFCIEARKHFQYIILSTNSLMCEDINFSKHLMNVGIDRVIIPFFTLDQTKHDEIVGVPGAYNKLIKALHNISLNKTRKTTLIMKILSLRGCINKLGDLLKILNINGIQPDEIQISGIHISTNLAQNKHLIPTFEDIQVGVSDLIEQLYKSELCFSLIDIPWCLLRQVAVEKLIEKGNLLVTKEMEYTKVYRKGIRSDIYEPYRFPSCQNCQVLEFCSACYPRNTDVWDDLFKPYVKPIIFTIGAS